MNRILDIYVWVDILLRIYVFTYVQEDGVEYRDITDSRKLYMSKWFLLDLIGILPYDLLVSLD